MSQSVELAKSDDSFASRVWTVEKQMKEDCVKEGTMLEIILFKGAEYSNGGTMGGWGESTFPREYRRPFRGKMSQKPGTKILGIVNDMNPSRFVNGLSLDAMGSLLIPYSLIHSYQILTYKNKEDAKDSSQSQSVRLI